MLKIATILTATSLALLISESLLISPSYSQSAQQNGNPTSNIGNASDNNLVIQTPNQNNAQNRNEVNIPNIYPLINPLQTPVNTENDFGLNMSVGVNTLDASNVTVYLGFTYQPGRTNDHKNRMNRLQKEAELIESQTQVSQAQLQLLQKQIAEAEIRLQQLQRSPQNSTSTSPSSERGLQKQLVLPVNDASKHK